MTLTRDIEFDNENEPVYGLDIDEARTIYKLCGLLGEGRGIKFNTARLKICPWCSWTQPVADLEAAIQHAATNHRNKFTDQMINNEIQRVRREQDLESSN